MVVGRFRPRRCTAGVSVVSVQIVVHHTADGERADLMACVLHDPTNEVDVAATNAQQSQLSVYYCQYLFTCDLCTLFHFLMWMYCHFLYYNKLKIISVVCDVDYTK